MLQEAKRGVVGAGVGSAESGKPQAASSEIGSLLVQRYEVVRELGRGGMGIVYLCRDVVTGEQVALKRLRPPEDAKTNTCGVDTSALPAMASGQGLPACQPVAPDGKPDAVSYPLFRYFRDNLKSVQQSAAEMAPRQMRSDNSAPTNALRQIPRMLRKNEK